MKKIFTSLGENNNAVYAVIAIAMAKGTLRPIFTLMDKKQDPESRRYAAFREGVTEAVACPTYLSFAVLANKIAPKFLDSKLVKVGSETENNLLVLSKESRKKFDTMLKTRLKDVNSKKIYDDAFNLLNDQEKSLFKQYKTKLKVVKETTGFVGVCLAALVVIPAVCNVVLNPIMKKFSSASKKNDNSLNLTSFKDEKSPIEFNNQYCIANSYKPSLLYAYKQNPNSFGMKVGF